MRLRFSALFMAYFFMSILQSQTPIKFDLTQKFTKHDVHRIDVNEILPTLRGDNFSLQLTIGDRTYDMSLQNSGIIAENYALTAIDDNGPSVIANSRPRAYNGYLLGTSDSRVSLTFNNNFIYGFIREGGETMYIEPLRYYNSSAASNEFLTYLKSNIIPDNTHKCGVEKAQEKYKDLASKAESQKVVGDCFEVDWAIVSDFLMFQDFGSVFETEDHNIGVANDVQTNYDDEFADEIQYLIVEQQVFTTAASDPFTTSTDAGDLLSDFSGWGPSGFNQIHDVGSIWTGRDFDGGTVGIAWLGAICSTNFRYNALQNFTANANSKRVMVSHELGHNFDAVHDAPGSGFIMAPSVNNTNTWSGTSISDIENFYNSISCLAECVGSGGNAPIADFLTTIIDECAIGTVIFTDISVDLPTEWLWTFEGGSPSTSTSQNPTVTYNNPGTYDVTLEVTNNSGSDVITKSDEVVIIDLPAAEWFVSTNLLLAIFNNTSTDGDSYLWDFGDGNFSSDESPIHTYAMDGIYNVSMTVSNSCGSDTYFENIEVATIPTADFSATPTSGCTSLIVTYSDLSSSNTTGWSWEFEGGVPETSASQNPTVTYNTAGVYDVTLIATTAAGNDEEVKMDYITVAEPATSDYTFMVTGGDVTFTNTSTNADTYNWEFGNGDISMDENPVYTYTSSGSYEVVLSALSTCGTVTDTQTVVISLAPVAAFTTVGSPTDCAEFILEYTDASTFNPETWAWTFEGGTPTASTEQNPSVTYSSPGAYDVTLTVTNAQGMNTITADDYVVAQDQVTAGFANTIAGLEVTFENQSSSAATSYVWDFGDGMTSTGVNPIHTYSEEGVYEITLTAIGPCNSDVITQTLNLYTIPTAGFTSDITEGCNVLTVSYSQTSSSNVTAYAWTFEGGTPSTSLDANPTVVYNAAGTYNVELIVSNPTGSSSASEVDFVTVSDVPSASFVGVNNMLTVTFTNNSMEADSFMWDFGDGNTSSDISPIHTYATEGDYTVTLTATNSCGDNVITSTVGANALPSANGSASITAVCEGDEVTFTDMSSDNVTGWLWAFEGATPAESTEQNPVVTYNLEGTFDVSLIVTATAGTDEILFTDLVTVSALPSSLFIAVNNMQEVTFTNNSIGATAYAWDFGDGNTSTDINPIHTYDVEGDYIVSLTTTNQCGEVVSTQTITANSLPTANGSASTNKGCGTTEIQFTDNSSNNVLGWLWTFEGGNPATSTEQNPIVIYTTPGIYDVSLIVSAEAGDSEVIYEDLIEIVGFATAEFDIVANDLEYSFTYTGLYGENFIWDFGDGNTSSEINPVHVYENYGMYTVNLRASNECVEDNISKDIDIISSVLVLSAITDLKIFPNPAIDRFYIEMELAESVDLEMQVMDIYGRLVQKQLLTNLGLKVNHTIDLTNEPSGTYLLRFVNGSQVRNAKIVLSK